MAEDIISTVPYFCGDKGCPVGVHIQHYWIYDDGTYSVCDSDGNHDGCDEADVPDYAEERRLWREYAKHVLSTGQDPLREFFTERQVKEKQAWQFKFANSILGPMLIGARRNRKTYTARTLPKVVETYLGVNEPGKHPAVLAGLTWESLVEHQPHVKPRQWAAFKIEAWRARPARAIKRDLKAAARRHLSKD